MNKSKLLVSLLLVFFLVISVVNVVSAQSAQGCDGSGWKGRAQLYENKTVCVTCTTCNFINFTSTNGEGDVFLINQEMNKDGSTFCYEFNGTQNNVMGTYQIDGYSQLEVPLGLCYDVTLSGKVASVGAYIIILILIFASFIGLIWFNIRFNAERRELLYDKIIKNYFRFKSNKSRTNSAYLLLLVLAYGILRLMFAIYYLIIFTFLVVFSEIVAAFGIVSLEVLMPELVLIFTYGLFLIGLIALIIFTELSIKLMGDIRDNLRGVYDGK